jgi:hypothetical protein
VITNLSTLSGSLATTNANLTLTNANLLSLSGVVATKISLTALSANWPLSYNSGTGLFSIAQANTTTNGYLTSTDFTAFNAKIGFISGTPNGLSVTGTGLSLALANSTTTGALSPQAFLAFSGKINLTSLSSTGWISYNNTTGQFTDSFIFNNGLVRVGNTVGLSLGSNGQVLTMSGWAPTWTTPAWWGISTLNGLNSSSQTFAIGIGGTSFNISSSGSVHTFNIPFASATATWLLTSTDWTKFNNKIWFLSGATNWLSISGTGLSLALASATTTGALSIVDYNNFSWKVWSINGLTGAIQTFSIGTSGLWFNIVSSGSVHTFNIPDASGTARGLVSTGAQTFTWTKTFTVAPILSWFTQGSILFAGTGWVIAQDNASIYYNGSTKRLGLGTTTPRATLHNAGSTLFEVLALGNFTASGTIGTAAATVDIKTMFNINQTTSSITLSLPSPTDTTAWRIAYVNNVGTASFFFLGTQIIPWNSRHAIWNGTAWKLSGNADDRWANSGNTRKAADEIVNNSAAVQNDDHLSFAITAGDTWLFQINGTVRNGATNNLRLRMQLPGAPTNCSNTAAASYNGSSVTNAACNTDLILRNINNQGATLNSDQFSYVWVFTTNTTGTAQFQWAQGTAAAVNTTITKDTVLSTYRISGADVAEVYFSEDDTAKEGDIVSLTGNGVSQVTKSSKPYDNKALGIISTKPGLVLGEADGSGKPVIVGLAGRVPVKVTTKNGDIQPGDYITTSDIPGVGMKATEAGRIIGKALTGLSGVDHGTVVVFIQNTYSDGLDEAEYAQSLSGSDMAINPFTLDRFSFMVKKSLTKIDPNYLSGSVTTGNIDVFGNTVNTLANNMSDLSFQIASLSGALALSDAKIRDIQESVVTIGTSSGNTNTIAPVTPETTLSEENNLALSMILGTAENLIIQGKTIFQEMVIFTQTVIFEKAVVFKSLVTFEDRVVFGDRDMGGSVRINPGQTVTRVVFDRPYTETPVVTISAVDHYVVGTVANLSPAGFDIEISSPSATWLKFNWLAVLVKWGVRNSPTDTSAPLPEIPLPTTPDTSSVSWEGEVQVNPPSTEVIVEPPSETLVAEIPTEEVIVESPPETPINQTIESEPVVDVPNSVVEEPSVPTETPVVSPEEPPITPIVSSPEVTDSPIVENTPWDVVITNPEE